MIALPLPAPWDRFSGHLGTCVFPAGNRLNYKTYLFIASPLLNYNIYLFIFNRPLTDHTVPQQAGGLRGAGYNK